MKPENESMSELVWRLVQQRIPVQMKLATVVQVYRDRQSCKLKPVDDAPELFDARLAAVIKDKDSHVIAWPKVDSIVVVGILNNRPTQPVILQVSEMDELEVVAPKVTVNADETIFNGGSKEGVVNGPALNDELNKLKAYVQAIGNTLSNWTTVPNDGGAALKVAWNVAKLGKTLGTYDGQLLDDKVKH